MLYNYILLPILLKTSLKKKSSPICSLSDHLKIWRCMLLPIALPVVEFYKIRKTPKGNFWILKIRLMGGFSSLQKSKFLMLIIYFFHYLWCHNWDQCTCTKWVEKTPIYFFFYFRFKNKHIWLEKNQKKFQKMPRT